MDDLNSKNIGASSHYPIPCHLQTGYKSFMKLGSSLEITEDISSKLLSLPIDENITPDQINIVCQELLKLIDSRK
jgi:dTDP-4-amino-4,6-dideoxygalactose transaminase